MLIPAAIGTILLLTSTTSLHETAWKYDVKRMLELWLLPSMLALALAAPGLRVAFAAQLKRMPRWLALGLLAVVSIGVVSAVHNATTSMALMYSLAEVALLALLVTGVLVVAACRTLAGITFDRVAVLFLAAIGVAVGFQELLGVLAAWASGLEFHPRIALMHFSWPRFYNQMQSWSMPMIAALPLLFPGKLSARMFCVLALALNWYVVIATGGRGTMLAVTFSVIVVSLLLSAGRRQLLTHHATGLLGGIGIYVAVVLGHGTLESAGPNQNLAAPAAGQAQAIQDQGDSSGDFMEPLTGKRFATSSGRVHMWRTAWGEFTTSPWLGNGPMNYACHGPTYREGHPHNFPLQLLHEWGAPATLVVLVIVLYLAFRAWSRLRALQASEGNESALAVALATGVLAAAVHGCLSGVFVMPASQLTGLLVTGWLLGRIAGTARPRHGADSAPPSAIGATPGDAGSTRTTTRSIDEIRNLMPTSRIASTVLASMLALSVALLAFAHREFAVAPERLEQTATFDRLIPRFWQNGKVCRLYRAETLEHMGEPSKRGQ